MQSVEVSIISRTGLVGPQRDRQTDVQRDRQTDRQTVRTAGAPLAIGLSVVGLVYTAESTLYRRRCQSSRCGRHVTRVLRQSSSTDTGIPQRDVTGDTNPRDPDVTRGIPRLPGRLQVRQPVAVYVRAVDAVGGLQLSADRGGENRRQAAPADV